MKKILTALSFAFFVLFGCNSEVEKTPTKAEIIEEKIAEKLARWEQSMRRKCTEDVTAQVEYLVDSTLIARARLGLDSIGKPLKPVKPLRPEEKKLKDTFPVKPILDTLPQKKNR